MKYPNLFHSRYTELSGRDWIKKIEPEEIQAFARLGFQESGYGKKGGVALAKKRGKKYMQEIGRRGALVTNAKKLIKKGIENEGQSNFS